MGITYKEFAWLINKNLLCEKVHGGVIGCPGNIVKGENTSNICRVVSGKEQCTKCWNREIPYAVIAEITGKVDVVGICQSQLSNGRKFLLQECHIDTEYPILLYENGEFFAAKKENFKFYIKEKFTNSDLKDGMMVEDELGRKWLYLGGKLRKPGICKDFNPDEICKIGYPNYESNFTINEILAYGFSKILWERKEAKEISSEEAFEVLKQHYGCDVKIKE